MHRQIKSVVFLWIFFAGGAALAQENNSLNTYTPYSMYGFGDIKQQGLTGTGSMGGISTGVRDVRQIDYVNPAAATARDSVLNFVLDFGGELRNFYSKSATASSAYNTGNFHHLAAAFRMGRFGANLGVTPFSQIGYEVERRETDANIIATAGDVYYRYRGEDGINQLFLNLGFDVTKTLAVGVGVKYYFGNLSRYYNVEYTNSGIGGKFYNIYSSDILKLSNFVPVFGAQYTLNFSKPERYMVLGASFQPGINMNAKETGMSIVGVASDGITYPYDTVPGALSGVGVLMPMQLSVGASLVNTDKWMLGAEFNYQDFSKTEIMGRKDMGASYSVKLGGYYIPNLYDVRYFLNRWTYRAGLRYSRTPFAYRGYSVNDVAISAGLSIPMRGAGYLNLGAEIGRRGTTSHGMVQETYVNFSLGITLFEAWFRKYQYE